MAGSAPPGGQSSAALPVFVARQPIFDRMNRRVAYELLYRADQHAQGSGGGVPGVEVPGAKALHALLAFGLERITGGVTAFVNIDREQLVGGHYKTLAPKAVVLELLETIEGDAEVLRACEQARAAGYQLALDDFDGRPAVQTLLPYAELVKLDVLHDTPASMTQKVRWLLQAGKQVLAERLETTAMLRAAEAAGCQLFQGYVFSRPETLNARALSVAQVTMMNLVGMLKNPDVGDTQLEKTFRTNPQLTFQLLRFVNSAAVGAREVESIAHAIRIIGREALSRWMLIMLVAQAGAQSPLANEAVTQALVRGRFCELAGGVGRAKTDGSTRFMLGLLSRMDALLGMPINEVLETIPVSADLRAALLTGNGPLADTLALAEAYEQGAWDHAEAFGSKPADLARAFGDAVSWTAAQLSAGAATEAAA
ncbi:MAG: EAL domain-containing protein [Gemmatimonadetes bacterium]|nr:EAL domain-containing protein [Gemmatimonadota bacterium]